MKFDERNSVNSVYELIARLFEREDRPQWAMTIADVLVELGEAQSWASVWWAYGAVHYDLSDEAYTRAIKLLARVDSSPHARAAALMLRAEIESTQTIEAGASPDPRRQAELLSEAVGLAPEWPSLRLRLAYPLRAVGETNAARQHARAALEQLDRGTARIDAPGSAITGTRLDREYVASEIDALGLGDE